jgi:tetratricopeptide (TPR) repeat protein
MSAILVVMTLLAQRVDAGIAGTDILPLAARISNACFAYVRYLRMTAWPAALSVIYPHPASVHQAIPTLAVMLSAALLAGVTIASFLQLKRRPWLLVGWLWFLGTLVPMIGLVQVGAQSVADRYMYLPSIGLFLAATWEISERASSWKPARRLVAPAACLVLALLAGLAWRQAGYWKNSETLFLQAAESSGGGENWYAEYLLGVLYQQEGRLADARSRFDKSLSIKPDHPPTRVNLGLVLARTGNSADGIAHLQEAARQAPDYYEAQVNLGLLQMGVGKKAEAVEAFRAALRIRPGDPTAASMLSFASR